ncbi:conserved hypothetical protein [Rubrivivax sp. A210]|uniref:hypothetical protein n=1 Tax=Rubrivivax sp. A210 TaxID=2772301 RepID=UPI00191B75CD|nr:hypothetical protein [Rubrivivax sp. A210]CAD5372458.1 conserved hypothetical protein [Rubrivivax sp. A210]
MRVNLVNYEEGLAIVGILSKYAQAMKTELDKLGVECTVKALPDPDATVNHHINYGPYQYVDTINTVMITHFTQGTDSKIERIREIMATADVGICFSPTMMSYLNGFGVGKLDYVLPAHDSIPRRPKNVAILSNVYPDKRKREWMLAEVCKVIDKSSFTFLVMGKGWEYVLAPLAREGFDIKYRPDFDMDTYKVILERADFVLYTGDEDCMAQSILDASQAGIRTISSVQDWQKDLPVDYPFRTQEDLDNIFRRLEYNPVKDWTWAKYTEKHLDIWKSVLGRA